MATYPNLYCQPQDVYALGFSAQAFAVRPRPVEAVNVAASILQLTAHGFTPTSVITFQLSGSYASGAPPAPLATMTVYAPLVVTDSLFQVALTPNGSPITLTDAGSGAYGVLLDQSARLQEIIWSVSREIDECLTGELPPIMPDPTTELYPGQLVSLCARMSARRAAVALTFDNAAFRQATDRVFAYEEQDNKQLEIWRLGKPLQPRPVDQDNIPNNGARASASSCPDRWVIRAL